MSLTTPAIKGPLNEWMNALTIEGCWGGATVIVRAIGPNPRDVVFATASGGYDTLPLLAGITLAAGDALVVMQDLAGEVSPWTPDVMAMAVGESPTDHATLAPVAFVTQLYECGSRVWINGAIPGAEVTVAAATTLASGQASEVGARLPLTTSMPGAGTGVSAVQSAPPGWPALAGAPTPAWRTVQPIPVPPRMPLPPPVLNGDPPKGCGNSVPLAGVIDGADVTITRASDGSSETSPFDRSFLTFDLSTPLNAGGDELRITQDMPWCQRTGDPLVVPIGPAETPKAVTVLPPCPGDADIKVDGLGDGTTVRIDVNGAIFNGQTPPRRTFFAFGVGPVPANAVVTVTQNLCGLVSPPTTVSAKSLQIVGPADLAEPLFKCAQAVRVVNATPGAWLEVWGRGPGGELPISNRVVARHTSLQIPVVFLQHPQEVWVSEQACGGGWIQSPMHQTQIAPGLPPVQMVIPPIDGDRRVYVDAVPGAFVEVFAQGDERIGYGIVDPKWNGVGLTRPLTMQDQVFATQTLCNQTSDRGHVASVVPAVKTFILPAPIERDSTTGDREPLVCDTASLVCRFDGSYQLTGHFENRSAEADVTFIFSFIMNPALNPQFGATLDGALSVSGNGKASMIGIRLLGVPSSWTFSKPGIFAAFRDPHYWALQVLPGTGTFSLMPAWKMYPEAEVEDREDPTKDKEPPPPPP